MKSEQTNDTTAVKTMRKKPPVLLTAVGRQRTGKTAFLNALTQTVLNQGGDIDIWNTDLLNLSHSISDFHPKASKPEGVTLADQRKWLEKKIEEMLTRRRDVVLDIGGGWTAFHEILNSTPLVPQLEKMGVKVVVVYMMGTELADTDYLTDLQKNRNFLPGNSLIILNEGLIPNGSGSHGLFDKIEHSDPVIKTIGKGGTLHLLPALEGMDEITDRELSYADFCNGKQVSGFPESGLFDRMRAEDWFYRLFPDFLRTINPDLLPEMPHGLPTAQTREVS